MRTTSGGSAERWGPLWGARAEDWAATEWQQMPTYEEAIRRVGLDPGQRVLDVGCGSGAFLRLAVDRGARAFGIDASEELLRVARRRVPEAELLAGDMEALPYEPESFDLVTGFNSFFFADDMVAALREAARVTKNGGAVVIQVWGRHERCDLEAMKTVVRPFLPPRPPDAPPEPELWRPGTLEAMAREAGLSPDLVFDKRWAYEFADEDSLGRAMLAPAGIAALVGPEREEQVRRRIVDGLSAYRTPEGGYRLSNEFHYLLARA